MKRKGQSGDKININNVHGSSINIAGGDINQSIVNNSQTASIVEFTRLLHEIQILLGNSDLTSSTKDAIKSDIAIASSQINNPAPKRELIVNRLKSAFELIITMGGAAQAGQVIGSMLQKAIEMAQKIL